MNSNMYVKLSKDWWVEGGRNASATIEIIEKTCMTKSEKRKVGFALLSSDITTTARFLNEV